MKRLPAEWERQDCVQLTWPHRETDFSPVYERAVACFVAIAKAISARQRLLIVCKDRSLVQEELGDVMNVSITFIECDTNDVWARDHGAITVYEDGIPVLYDFTFNGWGKKFPAEKDDAITLHIFQNQFFNHISRREVPFVLEGGSIESDGNGVLLTTESCLLSQFRNPTMDKPAIESFLIQTFGLKKVLWLSHGELEGDDTDGHIDTLARLVNEDTIAYVSCNDANDMHYASLRAMKSELELFTNANGRPYTLVPLPMVPVVYSEDGERLPATYANFLIMNDAVLLPVYNVSTDAEAVAVLQSLFPDKDILPIDCSVLILQHGSLHCVTMQYPHGVL